MGIDLYCVFPLKGSSEAHIAYHKEPILIRSLNLPTHKQTSAKKLFLSQRVISPAFLYPHLLLLLNYAQPHVKFMK